MQGYSTMDVRGTRISKNGYPGFYGYQSCSAIICAFKAINLGIHGFLWISMHGLATDSLSRVEFLV